MKVENKLEIKLIDGVFTPSDAVSLLTTFINEKIKYHKLDDFSNHIRYDRDSQHSKDRIAQLLANKSELELWMNEVKKEASNLSVKSIITIEIEDTVQKS
ncbi:hypothetical protein [Flavobacterium sp.]|uniref:hypothetical protein n=1 Tax=Flavobacterium sp. TaxID=239 RepID=UPI0025ECDF36|nr:hypothetical protein [Flavobacterium sp.]